LAPLSTSIGSAGKGALTSLRRARRPTSMRTCPIDQLGKNGGCDEPRQNDTLLIGIGIVLSACVVEPGYNAYGYGYGYNYPVYGSLNFDYWGGCCRHDFHDRGDHGFGHR